MILAAAFLLIFLGMCLAGRLASHPACQPQPNQSNNNTETEPNHEQQH